MPAARTRTRTSRIPTLGAAISCSSNGEPLVRRRTVFIAAVALWTTFEISRRIIIRVTRRIATRLQGIDALPELHEIFSGQLFDELLELEPKQRGRNCP